MAEIITDKVFMIDYFINLGIQEMLHVKLGYKCMAIRMLTLTHTLTRSFSATLIFTALRKIQKHS